MNMISGKDSRAPSGLCGVRQAEDVVHHIYERELGLIVQMAVDVRRGADVAVAQPFLDLLHGHVVGQQQRSAAVSNSWNSIFNLYCTISSFFEIN